MVVLKQGFQNRKKDILEKVINLYIEKGEPIASEFLVIRYHLDLSPATIRNEFEELSKEGYLYKCHISSGRLPTNKALKFFIRNIFERNEIDEWKRRWIKKIRERLKMLKNLEKVVEFLSEETKSFSFCYIEDEKVIIKKGLKYIFSSIEEEIDESKLNLLEKIAESLENFDNEIRKLEIKESPLIYIGKENPIIKVDNLSFLLSRPSLERGVFGILGRKRMPYQRNLGLLEAIREII
jgi:transcriptional regulator of heat shock response